MACFATWWPDKMSRWNMLCLYYYKAECQQNQTDAVFGKQNQTDAVFRKQNHTDAVFIKRNQTDAVFRKQNQTDAVFRKQNQIDAVFRKQNQTNAVDIPFEHFVCTPYCKTCRIIIKTKNYSTWTSCMEILCGHHIAKPDP